MRWAQHPLVVAEFTLLGWSGSSSNYDGYSVNTGVALFVGLPDVGASGAERAYYEIICNLHSNERKVCL
jgi:hypothetical protein